MIVDYAVYEGGRRVEGAIPLDELHERSQANHGFAWIGLSEPTAEEFDSVAGEFDLHPLAVEDAITAHQRPKLERYGDSLLFVLKTARWDAEADDVRFGEVLLFIGDDFIISVRHGELDLHGVRRQLESQPDILECGPSAVLYAIVDTVVDGYEPVVEALDASISGIERDVFSGSRRNPTERIFARKRDVLELYGAIVPLLEPVEILARAGFPQINPKMKPYFRDVHDHLLREYGRVQQLREVLTSILTANLTQASIRQNEDVRKISAWAAIIAVPTLITGVYGMNFDHMPELGWSFGYPAALALMGSICGLLYWRFRKTGWL
ncbi:MAG TPA: magnesium/cobalt transporter CorA [Gaiellaceae bacterium]|nr:magnesium/cobalt transporter CorA [Gaiellaceae bacterium]